jgi:hypothetical protein
VIDPFTAAVSRVLRASLKCSRRFLFVVVGDASVHGEAGLNADDVARRADDLRERCGRPSEQLREVLTVGLEVASGDGSIERGHEVRLVVWSALSMLVYTTREIPAAFAESMTAVW